MDISGDPADPEVQAIAAFLRVLNALENIRSSINVAERGRTMATTADMRDLARLSLAEASMRWRSCPKAPWRDPMSLAFGPRGSNCARPAWRSSMAQSSANPQAIDNLLGVAVQHLREARSALANPASLPPSFRN